MDSPLKIDFYIIKSNLIIKSIFRLHLIICDLSASNDIVDHFLLLEILSSLSSGTPFFSFLLFDG